jgi:hypothetical protein
MRYAQKRNDRSWWRRTAAIIMVLTVIAGGLHARVHAAHGQTLGFCPSTSQIFVYYNGMVYEGTAVRQPESWIEGWFADSYTFVAIASDGSQIWGEFRLSEANCSAATLTGGWTTPEDLILEGWSGGGLVFNGGGGWSGVDVGTRDGVTDSHGNCTSIMGCMMQ